MLDQQLKDKFIIEYNLKTKKVNSCVEWTGSIGTNGYGRISYKGKRYSTHRLSYLVFNNIDPGNLFVCHSCDNKKCINKDHLWLGTCQENLLDMKIKGRSRNQNKNKTHCKNNHEFTYLTTIFRSNKRICSICEKEYHKNKYLKKIGRPLLGKRTMCNKGHEWVDENIYTRPDGEKNCKLCRKLNKSNKLRKLLYA